jgi:hypothetical protein
MHLCNMLYSVNAYLHTYGDGGGWRKICSGEAYLGRFSGHRPYRQFSPDKPLHCYQSPVEFRRFTLFRECVAILIIYTFTLCREMKTVADVLFCENL